MEQVKGIEPGSNGRTTVRFPLSVEAHSVSVSTCRRMDEDMRIDGVAKEAPIEDAL